MSELENLFSHFLSSKWESPRLPYGYLQSYKTALSASDSDTARIFLNHGFKAWAVYVIVKPNKTHGAGQAAKQKYFSELDRKTIEEKAGLAKRIADFVPHPTVANTIKKMEKNATTTPTIQSSQTDSRETTCEYAASLPHASDYYQADLDEYNRHPHAMSDAAIPPGKRQRTGKPTDAYRYLVPPPNTDVPLLADSQTNYHTSQTGVGANDTEQDITIGADVEGLKVFPEYLRNAIKRDGAGDDRTAAVSMNFPPDLIADVDCIMTLEVLPNKVERIGMLLFSAHLETIGKTRELVLQGGTTAVVDRLKGSLPTAISEVLGDTIAAAIRSAPYRRLEELDLGVDSATGCVQMSDFCDADKGASITLTLGRRHGSQIFEKLFKSKRRSHYAPRPGVHLTSTLLMYHSSNTCPPEISSTWFRGRIPVMLRSRAPMSSHLPPGADWSSLTVAFTQDIRWLFPSIHFLVRPSFSTRWISVDGSGSKFWQN
ncbi:hypothetical protein FDECE_16279 [Fusarium decemcellulare]|nr:hypothetical protein FDECE_16279 [Fusarium decemcellulare]